MKTIRVWPQVHPLPSEFGRTQTRVLPLRLLSPVHHLLQQPLMMVSCTYSHGWRVLPRMLITFLSVLQLHLEDLRLSSLSTLKTAPPPAPWSASTDLLHLLPNCQPLNLQPHRCRQGVTKKAQVFLRRYLPNLIVIDIC